MVSHDAAAEGRHRLRLAGRQARYDRNRSRRNPELNHIPETEDIDMHDEL